MLDEDGSYIEDKISGRKIKFRTENGDFKFELWVPKAKGGYHQIEEPSKKVKNKVNFKDKNQYGALVEMDVDSEDDEGGCLIEHGFRVAGLNAVGKKEGSQGSNQDLPSTNTTYE